MKLFTFSLLLLIGISSTQSRGQSRADKAMAQQLQTDITYLASDALEGRRTSSEGEHKAAAYLQQRYTDMEIPPYKGQYLHPFHFVYGKEIGPTSEVRLGSSVMRFHDEAFPLPFSANKHAYSEILPDVMEAGNIWMISLYSDQDEANDPHFDAEKTMYEKSKEAEKQGASGVLFYDSYNSKWEPVFNTQSEYEALSIPVVFLKYDAYDKYFHHADVYETNARTDKGALPIELTVDIKKSDRTGTNVIAYIDNGAKYTVVLGAHYDHLGYGEDGNSLFAGKERKVHHGADDNASGTSAILEIAPWIKKKRLLHYNYMFVNFSGEELGLYGSKAMVKELGLDSTNVAYMINMDMVGRLNDSTHSLTLGGVGTSPAWGQFLNDEKEFKITVDSSGVGPSDHTSFYHAHIPVLFFFTGTHKDYHKPSDEAAKINYKGEVEVIKYAEDIVAKMDKSSKPEFTATKQNSVGKVNFKVTLGIMPDYTFQDGGVRIDGVSDGKPAMRAGLKEGDVIVQLGSYKVQGMQTYMEALGKFNPGDRTTVKVVRGEKQLEMPVEFNK